MFEAVSMSPPLTYFPNTSLILMALWLHTCNVLDCSTSLLLTWCGRLYSPRNDLLYNSVLLGWTVLYTDSSILCAVIHWWLYVMNYGHKELVNIDPIIFPILYDYVAAIRKEQHCLVQESWKSRSPDLQCPSRVCRFRFRSRFNSQNQPGPFSTFVREGFNWKSW